MCGKEDRVQKVGLNFKVSGMKRRPKQHWFDMLGMDLKFAAVHPGLALGREGWRHDTRTAYPAAERDRRQRRSDVNRSSTFIWVGSTLDGVPDIRAASLYSLKGRFLGMFLL